MGLTFSSLFSYSPKNDFNYVYPAKFGFLKHHSKLYQRYRVSNGIVGRGKYGVVRKAIDRSTGEFVAVKTIPKKDVDRAQLEQELSSLRRLSHPNIIRFIDFIEDSDYFHIVSEYYDGGDAFDRLKASGAYPESEARRVVYDLLLAVQYCHSKGILHRDLKIENLVFSDSSTDSAVKLIDFGLSHALPSEQDESGGRSSLHTKVGTNYYVSPEVLQGNYGASSDVWSLGVVAYVLLCGYPPFRGANDLMIFRKIERGMVSFPQEHWHSISAEAKDFIRSLLVTDPSRRLTLDGALNHEWFAPLTRRLLMDMNSILDTGVMHADSAVDLESLKDLKKLECNDLYKRVVPLFQSSSRQMSLLDVYNCLFSSITMTS